MATIINDPCNAKSSSYDADEIKVGKDEAGQFFVFRNSETGQFTRVEYNRQERSKILNDMIETY